MSTIVKLAVNGNRNKYAHEGVGIEKRIIPTKEEIREARRPMSDYRMRLVGFFKDVKYIEDSYSTNVNSAWWALESTHGSIVWIAGGLDRRESYVPLLSAVKRKVSGIVVLGQQNDRLRTFFALHNVPMTPNCSSMDEAVVRVMEISEPGSTVLLSPACLSFDMFENYEHRAAEFRVSVGRFACKSPTTW